MMIEVGRKYKTINNLTVKIIGKLNNTFYPYLGLFEDGHTCTFTADGKLILHKTNSSDLILGYDIKFGR